MTVGKGTILWSRLEYEINRPNLKIPSLSSQSISLPNRNGPKNYTKTQISLEWINYDNMQISDKHLKYDTASEEECSQKCYEDLQCNSFSFAPKSHEPTRCFLSSKRISQPSKFFLKI